jgi:hypothetical protein
MTNTVLARFIVNPKYDSDAEAAEPDVPGRGIGAHHVLDAGCVGEQAHHQHLDDDCEHAHVVRHALAEERHSSSRALPQVECLEIARNSLSILFCT